MSVWCAGKDEIRIQVREVPHEAEQAVATLGWSFGLRAGDDPIRRVESRNSSVLAAQARRRAAVDSYRIGAQEVRLAQRPFDAKDSLSRSGLGAAHSFPSPWRRATRRCDRRGGSSAQPLSSERWLGSKKRCGGPPSPQPSALSRSKLRAYYRVGVASPR